MKISETRAEGLLREYSILITAAEIDEQVSAKLAELATTVNMPGFRPGKVPMSVVKSRFGPQVQGEALKSALDEGARKAIEDNEKAVLQKVIHWNWGQPASFPALKKALSGSNPARHAM